MTIYYLLDVLIHKLIYYKYFCSVNSLVRFVLGDVLLPLLVDLLLLLGVVRPRLALVSHVRLQSAIFTPKVKVPRSQLLLAPLTFMP